MKSETENNNLKIDENNNLKIDENKNLESKPQDFTSTQVEPKNKKTNKALTITILCVCVFIVLTQLVLNFLGVDFQVKIVIEVVSFIIAFLISTGVLSSNLKTKDLGEIKNVIYNQLEDGVENLESHTKKIKDKITKTKNKE